jgi:hypothetical protein
LQQRQNTLPTSIIINITNKRISRPVATGQDEVAIYGARSSFSVSGMNEALESGWWSKDVAFTTLICNGKGTRLKL